MVRVMEWPACSLNARRKSWDLYFLKMAHLVATKSCDPSIKIGCVLVGEGNEVLSTGYNGLPRGIELRDIPTTRPEKYLFFEHAERNAIWNAARCGTRLLGCRVYLTQLPCSDCMRGLIQVGATEVVVPLDTDPNFEARWEDHLTGAVDMARRVNLTLRRLEEE